MKTKTEKLRQSGSKPKSKRRGGAESINDDQPCTTKEKKGTMLRVAQAQLGPLEGKKVLLGPAVELTSKNLSNRRAKKS